MIVFALSNALGGLAAFTLLVALVGALAALVLLTRLMRPALEIRRYAERILEAGLGIARNLDGLERLARTRELALAVPGLAVRYLEKLRA